MEDKRLMSSILTSIDASKPWSKCTSATITEFFDDGHGMCYHSLCQLHGTCYCDSVFFNFMAVYLLNMTFTPWGIRTKIQFSKSRIKKA